MLCFVELGLGVCKLCFSFVLPPNNSLLGPTNTVEGWGAMGDWKVGEGKKDMLFACYSCQCKPSEGLSPCQHQVAPGSQNKSLHNPMEVPLLVTHPFTEI